MMLWACRCTLSEPMGLCLPSLFNHSLTYSSSTKGKSPVTRSSALIQHYIFPPLAAAAATLAEKFLHILCQIHLQGGFWLSKPLCLGQWLFNFPFSHLAALECRGTSSSGANIWLTSNTSLWIYTDLEALTELCLHRTTFNVIKGFYLHFICDVIFSISLHQGAVKLVRMYLKFEGVFFFFNFAGALLPLINPR